MNLLSKPIFFLRFGIGWIFLYAGLSHLLTPGWSAAGYLMNAQSFTAFFHWLASPTLLPFVNALNAWGLLALGLALVFGVCVRLASILGAVLMVLYYLPILSFPYVGANALLVDEHIMYVLIFVLLAESRAGRYCGIDEIYAKKFWPSLG